MKGTVRHLNPDGLHQNAAYSQAVVVTGHVETALAAGGAKLEHVVRWNVRVVQGPSPVPGLEAFRRV
jgi:hypothetical protein